MSDATIIPVILSGGSGTRLWPMSRPEMPKQMLALTEERSMLQLTALRVPAADGFADPVVVANRAHAEMIEHQLADAGIRPRAILLEPAGRNTAPAIALAALAVDPDALILVMPSDHVIADLPAFHAAVRAAASAAQDEWLITFGITPDAPETGYGWIRVGEALADGVHRVDRFVEKPPRDRAEAMLASGDHVWNGGIFLFRAGAYLGALQSYATGIYDAALAAMQGARHEGIIIHPDAQAFAACPADSIDYAVMENAYRVAVVPVSMGWSDVGSWDALHAISTLDAAGNAFRGDVIAIDARNCLIRSDGVRVAVLGVEDLIVVSTGSDVLILPRGRSQEVKRLIEAMKKGA